MEDNFVKIAFIVPASGQGDRVVETMWAIRQDDGSYVLDNSPFSAFNISFKDRVTAKPDGEMLYFDSVVERGRHSTYRVKLNEGAGHAHFLKYWSTLHLLGCTYEGANDHRRLYSIDVPPSTSVAEVYRYLEDVEKKGAWEFEEAHYFDPQSTK